MLNFKDNKTLRNYLIALAACILATIYITSVIKEEGIGARTSVMKERSRTVTATTDSPSPSETGKTFYLDLASSTAGSVITLPASSTAENVVYRYVVADDTATTTNIIIDSSFGDNIYGSFVVDGAAVPCDAEDQVNFVTTNIIDGDFIEIRSNGTKWFVYGIGEAAGSITCTDPS